MFGLDCRLEAKEEEEKREKRFSILMRLRSLSSVDIWDTTKWNFVAGLGRDDNFTRSELWF